ncbi:hypothetical protein R5W24_001497 [Gemmata sp. JC717]|uniref:hypothetical protein n=1 Tax=Gemmata algarum TaxID=2975278 RepID=UPI0021BAC946|nr:hypothetical protein [Gemmata algarum]MDY3552415.1 hypothetical protein [Gemmata algarum]
MRRAYYHCARCPQSFIPYDEALGLRDSISPGFRPLVCLAGTLLPFADAAEDIVRRYTGVRLSASTVLRCTEAEGERLRAQLRCGRMIEPTQKEPGWTKPREGGEPAADVGLDAFSVPMQGMRAGPAEHRMLYTAVVYTPDKKHHRYWVDFELDVLAEQLRPQLRACGLKDVGQLVAITDGGNGLEEALHRHLSDKLSTVLDWYHAAEHLSDFAAVRFGANDDARRSWADEAKGLLYERGGEVLLTHRRAVELPAGAKPEVVEELRTLIGYVENNRHRTDYPGYRAKDWDIGSGPTEAGCKIIGERLKGSGMRWVEDGAATVGALRALYVSGGKLWDGFWSQAYTRAA